MDEELAFAARFEEHLDMISKRKVVIPEAHMATSKEARVRVAGISVQST
jgi:hypothetical protein